MGAEVWRAIKGYEGLYQVSNLGSVRSCDRVITQRSRYGGLLERKFKSKLMALVDNGNGYFYVTLSDRHNKRHNYYVHRLVAEAFIEKDKEKGYINHKDYNIKNNNVDNLEWCTQKENVNYSSWKMKHPNNVKPNPKTGECHISKRGSKFRLTLQSYNVDRCFKTLQEAVDYRERIFNEVGYTKR